MLSCFDLEPLTPRSPTTNPIDASHGCWTTELQPVIKIYTVMSSCLFMSTCVGVASRLKKYF